MALFFYQFTPLYGHNHSLAVNLPDGSALIYQALHLAKSLPFTDTSIKMSMLSVNDLLEKW